MRRVVLFVLTLLIAMCYMFILRSQNALSDDCPEGPAYAEGEVIITFAPEYMPAALEVTALPPSVGISTVDSIFIAIEAEYLIKLVPTYDALSSTLGKALERTYLVVYSAVPDPLELVGQLETRPEFERVSINRMWQFELHATKRLVPSSATTRFGDQWYLDYTSDLSDIDAPEAWVIEEGAPNVVVGIYDSGTMLDMCVSPWRVHSDMDYYLVPGEDRPPAGQLTAADLSGTDDNGDGYDHNVIGTNVSRGCVCGTDEQTKTWKELPQDWVFQVQLPPRGCPPVPQSWDTEGSNDHGTRVSSIAVGRLDGLKASHPGEQPPFTHKDIVGVAHGCKVLHARIGCPNGDFDAARALVMLADHCSVINMSFGVSDCNEFSPDGTYFFDAVKTVTNEPTYDCVLVSSTGNGDREDTINFPAIWDSVLAVGAISRTSTNGVPLVNDYSNFSTAAKLVDLVAPTEVNPFDRAGIYSDRHSQVSSAGGPCGVLGPSASPTEQVAVSGLGTSFAAPQVAGVAALVRSRFPGLDQFQVKQRLKRAAEHFTAWGATPSHEYGYGKVNAYRALTEWGSITSNTTWSTSSTRDGKYYVSGDLTIKDGATLTIAAGTIVRIAPDHESSGSDPTRVKIVVEDGGMLHIAGDEGAPVIFESFTDSPLGQNDWSGIEFQEGSSGSISHAVFRNAGRAIGTYTPMLVYGVTIENGILGIEHFDDLTILNSQLHDLGGSGIMIRGGELTANNVEITDCGSYGITDGSEHGRILIEDCTITDTGSHGILLGQPLTPPTETIGIQGTKVERAGDTGIFLSRSAAIVDCEVLESDIGIWLAGNSEQFTILNSSVDHNATVGVYVTGTVSATLVTTEVTNSVAGVFFDGSSSGLVHETSVLTDNSVGLKADNNSNVTVRHTRITANNNGVAALNGATFDLGTATSGTGCGADGPNIGNNSIYGNTGYNVSNLSPGVTIAAEGNWWNSNPPKASKFYGNVDRDPWICSDPNPTAPSASIDARPNEKPRPALPTEYSLGASQPNPFNPVTAMTFDVPPPGGDVEILIFDVKGTRVRTLVTGFHSSGVHSATWTGRSDSGEPIASGVYFARMNAPSFTQTRKLVLLK